MGDDFEGFCQQAQIILSGPPLDKKCSWPHLKSISIIY